MTGAGPSIDAVDRAIINKLQGGFPVCDRPYDAAARSMGISEDDLLSRLRNLLDRKILTRFGPMYNVERMGGEFVLAALRVPQGRFDEVAGIVNSFSEVAHNYRRDHDWNMWFVVTAGVASLAQPLQVAVPRVHELNMWFVVASDTAGAPQEVLDRIEERTGCRVYAMPKLKEYFIGLHFEA